MPDSSDSDSDVQVSDAIANVSDNLGVEYVISFRFDGAGTR